ncbi:MAG: EamA family transporter [Candidatus Omnitrophota bacterium]
MIKSGYKNKVPREKHLTLRILFLLIFIDFLETFAQFCFKKSALPKSGFEIKVLSDAFHFIISIIPSPFLWLGLFSVLLIFTIWSTILSRVDLSVAVPVCSFSYITIPLVSLVFLHEKISVLRWTGIFIILLGVILVSISSKRKEEIQ